MRTARGIDTGEQVRDRRDIDLVCRTLERIDDRAIAADGPVTPTLSEATTQELRRIYAALKRIQKRNRRHA